MKPLDPINIPHLTHAQSAHTCTQMLRQLGAEVIKVEPPKVGDDFRHYTEHAGLPGMSVPFAAVNAGKKSVTLNLKSAEGRDIALRLAAEADVFVENFKPGTIARLGLGYDALRAVNPRIIALSLSGFGQSGPLKNWGAYDHIAQATSGMAMMNSTDQGPLKVGMPIVDSFSGYLAVIGILAALRHRDQTGVGEYLDVAMLDSALKLIATSVSVWSYTGESPKGTGNRGYRLVATAEFYPTGDGWIALGANHQHQIAAMFEAFGHPELMDDPRFRDHAARVENYEALRAWLLEYLRTRRAADVETVLTAAGVPAAMIRDIGQIASHQHLEERQLLDEVVLPGSDKPLQVVGPGFSVEAESATMRVPTLGQDNDAVLSDLGYSEQDIARLRTEGVI
jgi:crotonobetainyl-CoA:carnitine CoA-transferase CaiB-like acyl-CoA transferase